MGDWVIGPPPPRAGRGRWSAGRKVSVVLELLRGTDLETLSRRHGVTAAKISEWRDAFLAGGAAQLRSRETHVDDEETQRLKRVVTEQAVSQELLREKIRALEASGPLGWWGRSDESPDFALQPAAVWDRARGARLGAGALHLLRATASTHQAHDRAARPDADAR